MNMFNLIPSIVELEMGDCGADCSGCIGCEGCAGCKGTKADPDPQP